MGFLKKLFQGITEPARADLGTKEEKNESQPTDYIPQKTINDIHKEKATNNDKLKSSVNYYIPENENDIALMKTSVAGITKHMKLSDAPMPVQGHTRFEPENPYNSRAVALITDDGRQIGYIADRELSLYYKIFGEKDNVKFYGAVGIFRNSSNKRTLYGKIMVVDVPESDDGTLFNLAQKQLDFMMAEFSTEQ